MSLERFGKITQQFGPVRLPFVSDCPIRALISHFQILFNSIHLFFQGIRAVLQKPWYKGDLTREQST